MKRTKNILCLILIFSLILTSFNFVFADYIFPVFDIAITDVIEPVVGAKPSFEYDVDINSPSGHQVEAFDLLYWFEFDEDYEDILEDMENLNNEESSDYLWNYFDYYAIKSNYNKNNSVTNGNNWSYSKSKITKFSADKTYMAVFFAPFYDNEESVVSQAFSPSLQNVTASFAKESVQENRRFPGSYYEPSINASVNGCDNNVKAIVVCPESYYKATDGISTSTTSQYVGYISPNYVVVMALYKPVSLTENLKATINWNDAEGHIPDSLKLKLMNGNEAIKEQTVTKANAVKNGVWEYTFEDVPSIDDNGNEITYTLAYEEVNEGDLKFFNTTVNDFTIDNTYIAPEITSKVKMRSIIDRDDNNVKYKIDYSASIKKYSGDANIEITTTLPFAINEEKSDLDGGTYDAKTRSIIWKETIEDIDNKYDYSTTKNVDLYATAVLPYSIEATTVGEIKLANAEDFNDTVDTVDIIESSTGNPKTGDNNLVKYLSIGLIGIAAILMVISIKRKYSTRKSNVQY